MCTVFRTPQQQNDRCMDGARDIKKLAESLSTADCINDPSAKVSVCLKELKYLQDELTSLDVGDIHFVLRGRLQYFVASVNYICDIVQGAQLIPLFEECMPGLVEISNSLERSVEPDSTDMTDWFKMSHIAINCLIVKILRKYPQSRQFVDIQLSECMTMSGSSLWEVQYLGISLILSSLVVEHSLLLESIAASTAASLKASTSSSKKPSSNVNNKLSASASTPTMATAGSAASAKMLASQSSKRQLVSPSARGAGAAAAVAGVKTTRATMREVSSGGINNENTKRVQISSDDAVSSSESNGLSVKIVSSKGLTSGKSFKLVSCIEEMYKSGFFRTLVWLLLHQNPLVRSCAAEILLFSAVKSSLHSDMSQSSTSSSDLWACCLEQGIVPQLEYVCQSIPAIATAAHRSDVDPTKGTIFPEPEIRQASGFVLECIAKDLSQSETTRSRVLNAMLHSGNTKLRLNIFSGLLYCCARNAQLGRILWESRGASTMTSLLSATNPAFDVVVDDIGVGGGVFNDLLHTLCRDLIELKSFLAVLIHFLNAAIRARSLLHCAGSEISTQTSFSCSDKPLTELVLNIEPTVVVIDTDRVNRMKCPSCSVISSHSTQLAGMISSAMERHLQQVPALLSSSGEYVSESDRIKIATTAIDSMDTSSLCQFYGSYRIWQEIFSHMVDSFIMKSSVTNMSTTDLIEAFHISTRYDMKHLQRHYAAVLADRLSIPSFWQIFQAGVGLRLKSQLLLDPSDSCGLYRLHLCGSTACVEFLSLHVEKLVTTKRPSDTIEIVKCLRRIVFYLLN